MNKDRKYEKKLEILELKSTVAKIKEFTRGDKQQIWASRRKKLSEKKNEEK